MSSRIDIQNLKVAYGENEVVKGITLTMSPGRVTALIGPSGCGKTTVLRTLNRLAELTPGCRTSGQIRIDGEDIAELDPVMLRRSVGMVFQRPNPFPKSIRENVLYGLRASRTKADYDEVVCTSLQQAALWDEVKDRLKKSALELSLGQQQRLCVARTLAMKPRVVLMDEPAASLDPLSTSKLEASIAAMREQYTVVVVTHNMQQALRVSDYTAFIYLGELVEYGETHRLFECPAKEATANYIQGKFG
jgi:phosphate transport system ATP-binding protein